MEQKIKVGDRVVGVGEFQAKNIDGKNGTVQRIRCGWALVNFDEDIGGWGDAESGIKKGHGWNCPVANLRRITEDEPAPSTAWSIHIMSKDGTTRAVLKQGKRVADHASAACSPNDAYDAKIGAAWAFLRLPGMAYAARRVLAEMDCAKVPTTDMPKPMPQPTYKPGDRVRIVEKWVPECRQAPNGNMDKWLGKTMTVRGAEKLHGSVMWYKKVEDKKDYRGNSAPGWNWWPAAIAGKVGESRKGK